MQNLSDDSVYNEDNSALTSQDEEEPQSLARVSRQTDESHGRLDRIQPDYMLEAKACVLTLLNAGVEGETIDELITNKHFAATDENIRSQVEETQQHLGLVLKKLDGEDVLDTISYVSLTKMQRNC